MGWGITVWQQAKDRILPSITEEQAFDLELADVLNPGRKAVSLVSWVFDCQERGLLEPATVQAALDAAGLKGKGC